MIQFLRNLYLTPRFFYVLAALSALFLISFWANALFVVAIFAVIGLGVAMLLEILMLWSGDRVQGKRHLVDKLSNGDENPIPVSLTNNYGFTIHATLVDEIPVQFQKRDFRKVATVPPGVQEQLMYTLRPVERGEYKFGRLNVFVSSAIQLVQRRYIFDADAPVRVYPSYIQMRKYAFLAIDNRLSLMGQKKIRKLGHTMEFEQIKEYVPGDDVRTINWKATAKANQLHVNQFQDEKAQPIYSILDSGRVMRMPFEGMTLLDYAVNATLALSNIAIKKKDKVGLMSLSNKIGQVVPASQKPTHINTLSEALYNIDTEFLDSDFGLMYSQVQRHIKQRSMILLYTNFEHRSSLQRKLAYLQAIARKHVLVVVFFQNTELQELAETPGDGTIEVVEQVIAGKFEYDKRVMVRELRQRGIHTVLTTPQGLTVNTINKYLELKKRGVL